MLRPTLRQPVVQPGRLWLALVAVLAALVASGGSSAQSGGTFQVRKQALVAGARSAGGGYVLETTAGEALAGTQQGGNWHLTGGFQTPRAQSAGVFADGFE